MRTPRSHFTCSVMLGKSMLLEGTTYLIPEGFLLLRGSYRWEDVPEMPNPQMDCLGISYKGKFHVLSDQVMGDDQVYTVVDWGESLVKTRYCLRGEWYNVGVVPPVRLPDHSRELEAFGYGFIALRHELYVLGGKVLKWEDSGAGRFDVVRLAGVRVCDPLRRPLNWREIRPMCSLAGGSILGCASMEEE
ncbi:F-box/kelch-repeat protein [Hibiscus syriacus]|uniref:F-box/kelch-repeat protein n=1 Tax=Hibiscus syriacus TaxID=106335 RepID=A0A6A2XTM7_HIBSY|nr:F-box/kelch-repeat protein [Hibiscus syriacus]